MVGAHLCVGTAVLLDGPPLLSAKDPPEDQADAGGQGGQDQEYVGQGHVPKADAHSQQQGDDQPRYDHADEDLAQGPGPDHGEDDGQHQQDDQNGPGVDPPEGVEGEGGHVGVFEQQEKPH